MSRIGWSGIQWHVFLHRYGVCMWDDAAFIIYVLPLWPRLPACICCGLSSVCNFFPLSKGMKLYILLALWTLFRHPGIQQLLAFDRYNICICIMLHLLYLYCCCDLFCCVHAVSQGFLCAGHSCWRGELPNTVGFGRTLFPSWPGWPAEALPIFFFGIVRASDLTVF